MSWSPKAFGGNANLPAIVTNAKLATAIRMIAPRFAKMLRADPTACLFTAARRDHDGGSISLRPFGGLRHLTGANGFTPLQVLFGECWIVTQLRPSGPLQEGGIE